MSGVNLFLSFLPNFTVVLHFNRERNQIFVDTIIKKADSLRTFFFWSILKSVAILNALNWAEDNKVEKWKKYRRWRRYLVYLFKPPRLHLFKDLLTVVLRLEKRPSWKTSKIWKKKNLDAIIIWWFYKTR